MCARTSPRGRGCLAEGESQFRTNRKEISGDIRSLRASADRRVRKSRRIVPRGTQSRASTNKTRGFGQTPCRAGSHYRFSGNFSPPRKSSFVKKKRSSKNKNENLRPSINLGGVFPAGRVYTYGVHTQLRT